MTNRFEIPSSGGTIEAEVVDAVPLATLAGSPEVVDATEVTVEATDSVQARTWPVWLWNGLFTGLSWLFGLMSLVATLAAVSVVPILQFASMGYLLAASGAVAKSGRLRDGFIDIPQFARIGSLFGGTWLMLLPIRLLAASAYDAQQVDPGSPAAKVWRFGLLVCTCLMLVHIALAWYSGGKLRHFFWPMIAPFQIAAWVLFGKVVGPLVRPLVVAISPALAADLYVPTPLASWFPPAIFWAGIKRGKLYTEARDAVYDFVMSLKVPYYFWLGLRGFVGAFIWLVLPTTMLVIGTSVPTGGAILVGWMGALMLAWVMQYLPFLQTHFACENRFRALFEISVIRHNFRKAPIAFWFALTITLLFAVPLYLLRIEAFYAELVWIPTLVFVVFIFPARLLTGWALGRALKHEKPRFFLVRWGATLAAIPVVLMYLLILFFTQYTSWTGPASLYEQHAFLLPVPFVGL